MKKIFYLLFFSSFVLFSCQKSVDWSDVDLAGRTSPTPTPPTGGTSGTLLTKQVIITPSDSAVSNFFWDSKNLLTRYTSIATDAGDIEALQYDLMRNASGGLIKVVQKPMLINNTSGIPDSIVKVFYYNPTNTSQLACIKSSGYDAGVVSNDSIALSYNASGKCTSVTRYTWVTSFLAYSKSEYTYTGNNITGVKISMIDGSTGALMPIYDVQSNYDSNKNPYAAFSFIELLAFDEETYFGDNNLIKTILKELLLTGTTITQEFTGIKFNSFKQPLEADLKVTSGTTSATYKAFYTYK